MILNINKPLGWSSFDVVKKVRNTLGVKKVGHAGTLDPLATGVLILLTGKDTKRQSEFMEMDKEYEFEMALGMESETYDLEGPVEKSPYPPPQLTEKCIETVFEKYVGEIKQKVPAYSAVKHKGKPLYKYARKGTLKEEMIPTKKVTIYSLDLQEFSPQKEIPIKGNVLILPLIEASVTCSKGTYVRSLAHDLGKDLGTSAVLTKLERTRVGPYKIEDSKTLEFLSQSE